MRQKHKALFEYFSGIFPYTFLSTLIRLEILKLKKNSIAMNTGISLFQVIIFARGMHRVKISWDTEIT